MNLDFIYKVGVLVQYKLMIQYLNTFLSKPLTFQDQVITDIDNALLSYEQTIAVASEEGVDVTTKEVRYEWTYVQSVFFSSTIITTVGKTFNIYNLQDLIEFTYYVQSVFFSSTVITTVGKTLNISRPK